MSDDSHPPDPPLALGGSLLLADPSLRDGTFDRSVILLAEHSPEEGAHGLILNQPSGRVVGDLLAEPEFAPLRKIAVHQGGPVDTGQLTFSAFWWEKTRGLRWSLRIGVEEAVRRSREPGTVVRAFVGYSGWSAGQLEGELARNAWIPLRPPRDFLGLPHDRDLWREILRGLSPLHRLLAEAPADPFLN